MIKSTKIDASMAVTIFFIVLALFIPHIHHGLNLWDEGVHIYAAKRVYDGQVPYRDFRLVYGPGRYYLEALLFRVFGLTVSTGKIYMVLTLAFASMATYLLARQIKRCVKLSILCSFLILHNSTSLLYIPTFDRMLWAFLSLLFVMKYLNKEKFGDLFLAGILAGFTFLIGHETGLCVMGAAAITLLIKFITALKKSEGGGNALIEFLVFGAGALCAVGPFLGYLAREGAINNYFFDAFQRYSRFGSSYLAMGQKNVIPAFKSLFTIPRETHKLRDVLYAHRFYGLMFLYPITLFYIFFRKYSTAIKIDVIYLKLLLIALFGMSMFYLPFSRYFRYYVLLVLPPGIILSAYFSQKILKTRPLHIFLIIIIAYLSFHYLSSLKAFINILYSLKMCQSWSINLDRAKISVPSYNEETGLNEAFPFKNKEEFSAIIDYIKTNTRADSKIFIVSHDAMLYFLTERDNATKFDHMIELYLVPEDTADQKDIIKDLMKNKARYIIFSNITAYWGNGIKTSQKYMEELIPQVYAFIIRNYELEKEMGYFELWALK